MVGAELSTDKRFYFGFMLEILILYSRQFHVLSVKLKRLEWMNKNSFKPVQ